MIDLNCSHISGSLPTSLAGVDGFGGILIAEFKVNKWISGTRSEAEQTLFNSSIENEGVSCARGDKEYAQTRWSSVRYRHSGEEAGFGIASSWEKESGEKCREGSYVSWVLEWEQVCCKYAQFEASSDRTIKLFDTGRTSEIREGLFVASSEIHGQGLLAY